MTRIFALLMIALLTAPAALAADTPETPQPSAEIPVPLRAVQSTAAGVATGAAAAAQGAADAGAAAASFAGAAAAAIGHALLSTLELGVAAIGALATMLGAALGAGAGYAVAHPKETAIAAGSVTTLATLYALARKFGMLLFLSLYSRLAPSQMLENEVRQRVYAHVKTHPGAHPSALASQLALGWGTVIYHLARLEESKLLTHRVSSNRKCFFAIGAELDIQGRDAVAAIGTDKAKAIVAALRAEPRLSQKDLAERLGISQALASWHVKRLVASGVLTTRREGRSNLLAVAVHVPLSA